MVYSAPFSICSQLPSFQAYGWVVDKDGTIEVDWDDDQTVLFLTGNEKGCTCKRVSVPRANVHVIINPVP